MPILLQRFWPKVQKNGPVMPGMTTPCWVWTGARITSRTGEPGYGETCVDGRVVSAHRTSWELHNGPIPDGLWVLHRCDHRPCVRPDHLFLGTAADNTADMVAKGRSSGGAIVPLRGEAAPWRKLSAADVLEIDRLSKTGVVQTLIAERFHVHRVTVSQIKRRRIWKHLFEAQP